jgi:sigma-B regulation protein RsbU (phosphoserine phosphatase)
MPQFVVIEGPDQGKKFFLREVDTAGRHADCSVRLTDSTVFDRHIRTVRDGTSYSVQDLSRLRSLSVNGKAKRRAKLQHGDVLKFGKTVLIFSDDDAVDVPEKVSDEEEKELQRATRVRRRYGAGVAHLFDLIQERDEANQKFLSLLRIAEGISAFDDLPDILENILDVVMTALPSDNCSIILYDEGSNTFRRGAGRRAGAKKGADRPPLSRGVLREVFRTRESLLLLDAQRDDRFGRRSSVLRHNIRSLMAVPMIVGERFLGIIVLDSRKDGGAFSEKDLEFLDAIGHQASLVIENARLAAEVREKTRLDHELELAAELQRRVLPAAPPRRDDVEVAGVTVPALEVGGDYYDFVGRGPDLYVAVGDVSGKGFNAGLVMMMARSSLLPLIQAHSGSAEILTALNRRLVDDTMTETFMSFLLLRWVADERKLFSCGAGHEHLLVLRPGTTEVEAIPSGGLILGIRAQAGEGYREQELPFEPGTTVLLYSDGVTEAKNPDGEMFGLDRLKEVTARHGSRPAEELVGALLEEVRTFAGKGPQHDDITLVALRRK